MYITGSFVNQQGDTVTVHIVTGADRSEVLEIGSESSGLYFTDDPAETVSEVNDTFDHLLRQSATIRLLSRNFIPDFFSTSCRNAVVNIYKGDVCVFAGFIEPQTYSQPYNEVYDEIELNCIDALSALQYSKYKDVGALGVLYDVVKNEAAQRSFLDIIQEILSGVVTCLDIVGGHTLQYLFDGSKAVDGDESNRYSVFSQMSISELLFLGNEEDDVWQQDEVLEEILRYLNLHIIQDGFTFYIFSWETVKGLDPITWRNIVSGSEFTTIRDTVSISMDNVADCDTTISIGEVYNQLLLTCNIESVENVIESPLDADGLTSPFLYKQKYMTEFMITGADGNVISDRYIIADFIKLVEGAGETMVNNGKAKIVDWYMQIKNHKGWKFRVNGQLDTMENIYASGSHQENALNQISASGAGACLLSLGSVEHTWANRTEPVSTVSMTDSLVLTNFWYDTGSIDFTEEEEAANVESMNAMFDACRPFAEYIGGVPLGSLSPSDEGEANYIVFTGKVILVPVVNVSQRYSYINEDSQWRDLAPQPCDDGKRYYTQAFHSVQTPQRDPDAVDYATSDIGYTPFVAGLDKQYKIEGTSAYGMAVLVCMLVVGNKCLVELPREVSRGVAYEWRTYKRREQCADDGEYYAQCFYIRTKAAKDGYAVNEEHDVLNNVDLSMGLDTEGLAIPITKADALSGEIEFKILRPADLLYYAGTLSETRDAWGPGAKPTHVMRHVTSVVIKDLEVKVHTPSTADVSQGNDIIYMSDTDEQYVNRKDDLEFKISSALTLSECQTLGVSTNVKLSTPIDMATNNGVLSIYDHARQEQAKAEQFYVDSYYNEYHVPRVTMEQKLLDVGGTVGLFHHYRHKALNKDFFVQGISRNLVEGRADLTLKEIGG